MTSFALITLFKIHTAIFVYVDLFIGYLFSIDFVCLFTVKNHSFLFWMRCTRILVSLTSRTDAASLRGKPQSTNMPVDAEKLAKLQASVCASCMYVISARNWRSSAVLPRVSSSFSLAARAQRDEQQAHLLETRVWTSGIEGPTVDYARIPTWCWEVGLPMQ